MWYSDVAYLDLDELARGGNPGVGVANDLLLISTTNVRLQSAILHDGMGQIAITASIVVK